MEDKIVQYALLLNGTKITEIRLQYRLITKLIQWLQKYGEIDEDEFILIVEDAAANQLVSVKYAASLLQKSGCFVPEGEYWKYNDALDLGKGNVTWEQFVSLFQEEKSVSKDYGQADAEKDAVIMGIEWCVHMVRLALADDMNGLPAFLRCGEKDSLIGKTVAGTATSDALSLLCSGIDYIKECEIEPDVLADCFDFLICQTLGCQSKENKWDEGGFFPLEDQPEADHPTVDATCLAVMALCDFYSYRKQLEDELYVKIETENRVIEDAVLLGLEFLFRMQQPEGSYGIYRYEQEYPDGSLLDTGCSTGFAMPHENCTRMAVSAMGVCKGSGIFNARERFELYGTCSGVISRAYAYLKTHAANDQGHAVWAPYFGEQVSKYPYADTVVGSARVCRSLIPVWWQCEEERVQIKKFHADFLAFWLQEHDKIKGKIGRYSFKTPGKDSYSVGTYMWQSYPDMIAAFTVLQGYNMFGMALDKEGWKLLDDTVHHVLEMQHPHGHWNAPGTSNPFCAVTLAAIELLREYRKAKGL